MNDSRETRVVELLEEISSKLDALEGIQSTVQSIDATLDRVWDYVGDIKLEICALEHEGKRFPSATKKITDALASIQSELSGIDSSISSVDNTLIGIDTTLASIDSNTST